MNCSGESLKNLQVDLHSCNCTEAMCNCCSTDINECGTANGGCEHNCTNSIGSFICSCDAGYQLDGNGVNCSGESLKDLQVDLHSCNCTEAMM